jgi:hypothetical protein
MTRNFNRSEILDFSELSEELQNEVLNNFNFEKSDAYSTMYVISKFKGEKEALPLSIFIKTYKNNFTHGIYSDSYFSGYFITFSKCNSECVIAYKYF